LPALDIRQQCAGFAYGLQMVDALIGSGTARAVLLVGTDVHTSLMPFTEQTWKVLYGEEGATLSQEEFEWNSRIRHLAVLFGDAAGAMVFRAEEGEGEKGILSCRLYADGNHKDILYVPGGGSARRPFVSKEMVEKGETVPVMDGRQVFKLAVQMNTPNDLAHLITFLGRQKRIHISLMGMGPFGKVSRLVFAQTGSVLNYGYLDKPQINGQWSALELRKRIAELAK